LRIRDVFPGPGSGFFHPDKYFKPKNCYQALGNMIGDVYLGYGFFSILDPGSRGQKSTGSATLINSFGGESNHGIFLHKFPRVQVPRQSAVKKVKTGYLSSLCVAGH
jgi:hypothetical protein